METNNLFYSKQGGFRRGHSTIKTLGLLIDYICLCRNNRLIILWQLSMSTLKKAFNTVNHTILCKKMVKLGFSNILKRLLENYYKD